MFKLRFSRLVFPALLVLGSACASESGDACGDELSWVRIVTPEEGQVLSSADDTMPGGVVDYDVVVEHCGLSPEEQVELLLLSPVESPYGCRMADTERLVYPVPFIPGEQRMRARVVDSTIESAVVTFSVSP